jgi:hypothetical protein
MTITARIGLWTLIAALALLAPLGAAAQPAADDAKAIAQAKQLFQLIRDNKHADVAKEFNEKMAAAMPVEKLGGAWESVLQQTGAFKSVIGEQVQRPQEGFTAVILNCEFENAAVNAMFVFDAQNKVAGIAFRPRQ